MAEVSNSWLQKPRVPASLQWQFPSKLAAAPSGIELLVSGGVSSRGMESGHIGWAFLLSREPMEQLGHPPPILIYNHSIPVSPPSVSGGLPAVQHRSRPSQLYCSSQLFGCNRSLLPVVSDSYHHVLFFMSAQ